MSSLSEALDLIKDDAITGAKDELLQLITEGKASADAFIRENAAEVESWIIDAAHKDITAGELKDLIEGQTIVAKNFVSAQAIEAQKRAERLTLKVVQIAGTKILPLLLAV